MKPERIKRLLPAVYRRTAAPGTPIAAIVDVMSDLHAPAERALRSLPSTLNPRQTDEAFVPFLASWVDLGALIQNAGIAGVAGSSRASEPFPAGLGRLRELAACGALLSHWRGTGKGLLLFLKIATGDAGWMVEENVSSGGFRPFHLRITVPASAASQLRLVRQIVELEKPAHVTYELAMAQTTTG